MTAHLDIAAGPAHVAPRAADALVTDAWLNHHEALFGAVVRCTRDDEVAADIVADTFEALLREARVGRAPDNVAAWLHRVARNRVVDWSRRRARWARRGLEVEGAVDGPEASTIRREAALELHAALRHLPRAGRVALVLEGQGYRPAEIAPMLGRSGQATRTLLCRARRRVADELGPAAA